jgi:hypothetical protein
MSLPAWQIKFEEAQIQFNNDKSRMLVWLFESSHAKDIPDDHRNALLLRYGYKPPATKTTVKAGPKKKEDSNDV